MKISLLLPGAALALLSPALAWGQAPPPPPITMASSPAATVPFTVQGKLSSPTTGMAYLFYNAPPSKPDSAQISNGQFTLRGMAPEGTIAGLFAFKGRPPRANKQSKWIPQPLRIYLERGTVRVSSPDSLANATVLGTPLNVDNARLQAVRKPTSAQFDQLYKQYEAATPEQRQNPAFMQALDKQEEVIMATRKQALRTFMQRTPQSIVSLTALDEYAGSSFSPAEIEPLFAGLAPAVRSSQPGQDFATKIAKAKLTDVGAMAPDFTQNTPDGKPVALHDFRGKYVLVDFWASWCGPCRQENPNVLSNYNQFKGRNFTVLGVSLDREAGRDAWLKAIDADHLPWTQVSDLKFWKNDVAQLYGINSIPQNFLVGPDGRIVAKNLRGEELGRKLAAVLPASAP